MKYFWILISTFLFPTFVQQVRSHGRMMEPPNRSSIWRLPEFELYNTTVNWDDNQNYCGGFHVHYEVNRGFCGVCGDAFNESSPRPNEDNGIFDPAIIVRTYKVGQAIPIEVNLTQSHLGYFEFRLCARDDVGSHIDQACYDEHLLELATIQKRLYPPSATMKTTKRPPKGQTNPKPSNKIPLKPQRNTKFFVESTNHAEYYNFQVKLPKNIRCKNCVLQWDYRTASRWGYCEGNRYARGCGPQETFRGCADIAIR